MARLTAAQRQTMLDSPWFGALPTAPRDEALEAATLRHFNEGDVIYALSIDSGAAANPATLAVSLAQKLMARERAVCG